MVAAGMGFSIVPASTLAQNQRLAAQVQRVSVNAFEGALSVWLIWSHDCRPVDGTTAALAAIFAGSEVPVPLRLAPAPGSAVATRRPRRGR